MFPVCRYYVDIMESVAWHTQLPWNEFDYLALMGALGRYKRPRDKVRKLLRSGDVIRVKKGIYVLGPHVRRFPEISREILGNLIYGPSYISLEYALSWHQLIPERVESVTSVTLHKSKSYATPVGNFTYRHVQPKYYSLGLVSRVLPDGRGILMAGPEKAIADKVYFASGIKSLADMRDFLFADSRIDPGQLRHLDSKVLLELAAVQSKACLHLLSELVMEYA